MSLQWTVIGGVLYCEMGLTLVLILPFIPASMWQKVFNSSMLKAVGTYINYFFSIFLVLLVICFADSVRMIMKYSHTDTDDSSMKNNLGAIEHIHMKLFRAQRNFYIAGFSLFLWFVLRRLVTLISSEATLTASKEAAIKQAKSASDAARRLMDEQSKEKGDEKDNNTNELDELKTKLRELKTELRSKEADLDAMKTQAQSTNREYDRLSSEYQKLQDQMASEDKKSS